MKSIFDQMVERLFPTVGRQAVFPMKCVLIQDIRNYDRKIIKKQIWGFWNISRKKIWGFWNFYVFCAQKYDFIMTNRSEIFGLQDACLA